MLFAVETWPFTVAMLLLVLIAGSEALAVLMGTSMFHWLEQFAPDSAHPEGVLDRGLGWLRVGRVPVLILIVTFLAAFAMCGFAANIVSYQITGAWLPPWISVPIALVVGLPIVRMAGNGLSHLVPRDESSAVTLDTLIGRVAIVVSGKAKRGYPAEAKVANQYGQTLYIMLEPDTEDCTFEPGSSVLLVRQISGNRFAGIANPRPDLL
jgi:hypothetical protein